MGDLDDFFAKKDKKKKGAKKFSKANTDVLAKNLQETERKEQKEQEKQDKQDLGMGQITTEDNKVASTVPAPPDDEEWDDYRENKKDYSGLKIESLKIEEPQEEEEDETEINEDGEVVSKKKDESGPWNKLAATGIQQQEQERMDHHHQEVDAQIPNVVGGSYVPPHMRGAGGASTSAASTEQQRRPLPRGKNKAAPDISSEVYFPSLSASLEDGGPKGAWGKGGAAARRYDDGGHFEEVKESGGKGAHLRHTEAPKLTLGNKFDALREGD